MRKIFFDPQTLVIKGMSDGEDSMEFPYVLTDVDYFTTDNLYLELDPENAKVSLKSKDITPHEPVVVEPVEEVKPIIEALKEEADNQ